MGAAIGATKQEAQRVKDLGVQWVVLGQNARALADALKSNLDQMKKIFNRTYSSKETTISSLILGSIWISTSMPRQTPYTPAERCSP